ncbi:hypothetical protein ZIOFF_020397 [Zingiber officinale]|uniref:Uncharacterized protein n=1 Tax=Zingiber officinale TaxID=94328 RepID=A0A8J5H699_ZINOF|nr:hypothetical protein ZIOFF_020397 [Zingiber officinale]
MFVGPLCEMKWESEASRLVEPGIEVLPEGCIAHAISLTSPRDACCSTAVSTAFRSAVASDTVWNSFLPSDLESILARADRPVDFSSKKELFFRLCDKPILLDGGKMIFSLDRSSGAKCFMLSARELAITFSEVAELLSVCWLEIRGHFKCKMLSSKTTYAAYLIFKLSDRAYGLGHPLQEASVELGTESSTSVVCLQSSDMYAHMHARRSRVWFRRGLHWRRRVLTVNESQEADDEAKEAAGRVPQLRNDGWMEIELGEFYNCGEEDKDVHVSLLEVKGGHWKIGLIIEGIEIRPKKILKGATERICSILWKNMILVGVVKVLRVTEQLNLQNYLDRFSEVAEILRVCWLEICGHFQGKMLSSKTTYAAYLIFKLSDRAYELGHPLQASVELGTKSYFSIVCLQPSKRRHAWRNKDWFLCHPLTRALIITI